jgi:3-dehydroquinate synthase
VFILVDPSTRKFCLPVLLDLVPVLSEALILETVGGESAKSFANAEKLWNELAEQGADRYALLVNLGGGVVTDLGGFIAATFMRGISCINVPTTLIGQVDAAIGGKNGINLGHLKNQVGTFYPPLAVAVFPGFLKTLAPDHLRSGMAEIIKISLISPSGMWKRIYRRPLSGWIEKAESSLFAKELIGESVKFKTSVVTRDFREKKYRKILNFGHTVGHAVESLSLSVFTVPLLHGEAVAAGIVCAAYLSFLKTGLSRTDMEAITSYITEGFGKIPLEPGMTQQLISIMSHDKKATNGAIRFTLIKKPGCPVVNMPCSIAEIGEAIDYYINSPGSSSGIL